MSVIYQPKGRAGEYADWAANLYVGCSHKCRYCYGAKVLRMPREEFDVPRAKDDIVVRMGQAAANLARRGQTEQVLLSFVCDDYQPLDAETGITRACINALHRNGQHVCILTKGGTRALRDIDLMTPKDAFACSLTCLDVGDSLRWEPGAATPQDRLVALEAFHRADIPTWVSLEPVIRPEWTLRLIRLTHRWVDMYKVGKMNYQNSLPDDLKSEVMGIDWGRFGRDAIKLLESLGKDFLVKDDLAKLL